MPNTSLLFLNKKLFRIIKNNIIMRGKIFFLNEKIIKNVVKHFFYKNFLISKIRDSCKYSVKLLFRI